ncbi:hypothetical protein [Polaromonas sp. OV174]|uniref:hypothetical protein n=1 Tax=Polaromonas sp. OV174 TaxID=1855300 RepID=UPI000AE9F546|nr:hypothetical protein [Polaromonas sp. OV174]
MKISQWFGFKNHKKPTLAAAQPAADGGLSTIEEGSPNSLRRQLVQVLLRDVMRRHGIPSAWIDCQLLVVSSRSRGEGMYVRLIIKHWDPRLLNYAHAFQNTLMMDISRFEPQSVHWLFGVSWQLELGNACPYQELPDRSVWTEPPPQPVEHSHQVQQDLERIFAIRDADMLMRGEALTNDFMGDYAQTQPQALTH